ncbi:hypothetical protein Ancab_006185 [Ancistrocladus abbreviatus]
MLDGPDLASLVSSLARFGLAVNMTEITGRGKKLRNKGGREGEKERDGEEKGFSQLLEAHVNGGDGGALIEMRWLGAMELVVV